MEHEHVTLQSSEDYQELFERFLSAVGISPAEFKAYLAASVPHCGALRTVKNGLAAETAYEGIFLSENSYIIMDTLRTPETRVSRQEMEEYLAVHNARLPAKAELKRFDAWKNSFRCVLAKVYSAENVPAVYCDCRIISVQAAERRQRAAELDRDNCVAMALRCFFLKKLTKNTCAGRKNVVC